MESKKKHTSSMAVDKSKDKEQTVRESGTRSLDQRFLGDNLTNEKVSDEMFEFADTKDKEFEVIERFEAQQEAFT